MASLNNFLKPKKQEEVTSNFRGTDSNQSGISTFLKPKSQGFENKPKSLDDLPKLPNVPTVRERVVNIVGGGEFLGEGRKTQIKSKTSTTELFGKPDNRLLNFLTRSPAQSLLDSKREKEEEKVDTTEADRFIRNVKETRDAEPGDAPRRTLKTFLSQPEGLKTTTPAKEAPDLSGTLRRIGETGIDFARKIPEVPEAVSLLSEQGDAFQTGVLEAASAFEQSIAQIAEEIGDVDNIEDQNVVERQVARFGEFMRGLSDEDRKAARVLGETLKSFDLSAPGDDAEALAQSIARNAPNILGGILTGGAGFVAGGPIGGTVAVLSYSAALEGGFAFNEAMELGATEDEAESIMLKVGIANGILETIPITRLLNRTVAGRQVKKNILKDVARNVAQTGAEEATTEFVQEVVTNAVMREVDENRELFEGAPEAAFLGGLIGGGLGLGGSTISQTARQVKERGGLPGLSIEDVSENVNFEGRESSPEEVKEFIDEINFRPKGAFSAREADVRGVFEIFHKDVKLGEVSADPSGNVNAEIFRKIEEQIDPERVAEFIDRQKQVREEIENIKNTPDMVKDEEGNPRVLFHGTQSTFEDFSQDFLGKATKAKSAERAFFFTDKREVAETYAKTPALDPKLQDLIAKQNSLTDELARIAQREREGRASMEDVNQVQNELSRVTEELENRDRELTEPEDPNIIAAAIEMSNPLRVSDQELTEDGFTDAIERAREEGYDGVIFENITDTADGQEIPSNVYAILDPNQIKIAKREPLLKEFNVLKDTVEEVTQDSLPTGKKTQYDTEEVIDARNKAAQIPDTSKDNSSERISLRDTIIENLYGDGARIKNRRADIVIGPPAAGKSKVVAEPLAEENGSLIVDSDLAKEEFPEYENGIGAAAVHPESDIIWRNVLKQAVTNGDNIVLPLVGKNTEKIRDLMNELKSEGYEVFLHLNEIPPEEAAKRAVSRFAQTGRFVDPAYVLSIGWTPTNTYDTLKNDGTGFSKVSNDVPFGEQPVLIERKLEEETLDQEGLGDNGREQAREVQRGTSAVLEIPQTIEQFDQLSFEQQEEIFDRLPVSLQEELMGFDSSESGDSPLKVVADDVASGRRNIRIPEDTKTEARSILGRGNYARVFRDSETLPTLDEVAEEIRSDGMDVTTGDVLEAIVQRIDEKKNERIQDKEKRKQKRIEERKQRLEQAENRRDRARIIKQIVRQQPTTQGAQTKRVVRRTTSQTDPSRRITKSESTLLKEKFRNIALGAREANTRAKRETRNVQDQIVSVIDQSNLTREDKSSFLKSVKNIQTAEQLQKKLPEIQERIERLTDNAQKRNLKKKIFSTLKKTKVQKQSGKPVGKFTPDVQRTLDLLRNAATLKKDQAQDQLVENLLAIGDNIPSAEQALENRVLTMRVQMEDMSAAELQVLLGQIEQLVENGRMINELKRFNRLEENQRNVDRAVDVITGGKGLPEDIDLQPQRERPSESIGESVKRFLRKRGQVFIAWNDIIDILASNVKTDPGSTFLDQFTRVLEQKTQEKKIKRTAYERIRRMTFESFGIQNDKQLQQKFLEDTREVDLGTFVTSNGVETKLTMTKQEARKRWMEMKDPSLRETFRDAMGYTVEMISAIDTFLTAEDKIFAQKQLDFYREFYNLVNPVYQEMYGVDLPFNEFYSPIRRKGINRDQTTGFGELLQEVAVRRSIAPGSLKSRVRNLKPIELHSDVKVLEQHISEMTHFVSWATKMREFNAVFGDSKVRTAIIREFGKDVMGVVDSFLRDFTRGGVDNAQNLNTLDKLRGGFSRAVLAIKPSIGVKQLTSFIAYADRMPVSNFVSSFAKFWANPVNNAKTLYDSSELLKDRQNSIDRDLRVAMKSDELANFRKNPSWKNALMLNIRAGDFGAIITGGWALYDYNRTVLGKTHEEAIIEFERVTEQTQQSSDLDQLSYWQRGNSFAKLFTMFLSAPNQFFRKELGAIRNLSLGRGDPRQHAKTIVIYHFLIPMFFQWVSDLGEWDEEEQLRSAILGSFNGIFIVGDAIDGIIRVSLGMRTFDSTNPVVSIGDDVQKAIKQLTEEDEFTMDDFLIAMDGLLSAGGPLLGLTKIGGLPLEPGFNVGRGVFDVLSGKYAQGLAQILGWSPYISGERFKPEEQESGLPGLPKLPKLPGGSSLPETPQLPRLPKLPTLPGS